MSLNAILVWVLAIVVVGGGASYFMMHKSVAPYQAPTTQSDQTQTSGTQTVAGDTQTASSGTFANLLAEKGDMKCTFTGTEQGSQMSGTVYISSGGTPTPPPPVRCSTLTIRLLRRTQ